MHNFAPCSWHVLLKCNMYISAIYIDRYNVQCKYIDSFLNKERIFGILPFLLLLSHLCMILNDASYSFLSQLIKPCFWLCSFLIFFFINTKDQKSRPSVLVLELEMAVLRIVNLYFYRTSLQRIGVQVRQNLKEIGAPFDKQNWHCEMNQMLSFYDKVTRF